MFGKTMAVMVLTLSAVSICYGTEQKPNPLLNTRLAQAACTWANKTYSNGADCRLGCANGACSYQTCVNGSWVGHAAQCAMNIGCPPPC